MHIYHPHFGPTKPSTNGAPQVVAVGFLALVFFMLLFPMAQVSFDGIMDARPLLKVLKTDAGVNIFAWLLLLAPPVGIAVAMLSRSAWRIASAAVAVVAAAMIPLTLFTFSHSMHELASNTTRVAPGLGSYILLLGYLILAIVTGTAALRAHRSEDVSKTQ